MTISSWNTMESYFDGYFFFGNDYIYGPTGLDAIRSETNFQMGGGLDGCYVYMRRTGGTYEFMTDYSGYRALYYYHDGVDWVVSDSFSSLADTLRYHGKVLSPDYAQLGAICSTASTNNQLFSWNTPLHGVKLLPRGATLFVTDAKVIVTYTPVERGANYEHALTAHLDLWVSRFATILSDSRLELSLDLTGGADSRTNFGLAHAASVSLGTYGSLPRFTCGSSTENSPDMQVASLLCESYGYRLNMPSRIRPRLLSADEGYSLWRDYSLGVYYPLVIPGAGRTGTRVHISGGGGEVHRDYYGGMDLERFAKGYARRNMHSWLGHEAAQLGAAAASEIANRRNEDPLRSNYREFRHRYHVGRTPRNSVSFTPLDSATAEHADASVVRALPKEAQFNFDLIASLDPELLHMPFDKPHKAPSREALDRLVVAHIQRDAQPGKLWGVIGNEEAPGKSLSRAARAAPFAKATNEAANDSFVQEFCGDDIILSAAQLIQTIVEGGSIGNPVNGHPVSAVLTAYAISPTRGL